MFCSHCGKEIQPGTKFCPACGADVSAQTQVTESANKVFQSAEGELTSAVNEVRDTIQKGDTVYAGERLTDNRGLISYILLSIITCGIYSYYFVYKMAHDVNIACSGDGQETGGLLQYILLSIVRRAVELCGGQVTVFSKPDKGSTFTVTLTAEEA